MISLAEISIKTTSLYVFCIQRNLSKMDTLTPRILVLTKMFFSFRGKNVLTRPAFFVFPRLDGLPLPPPPALGVKVLDSWKYQQSNKAARLQATLGVGQINISGSVGPKMFVHLMIFYCVLNLESSFTVILCTLKSVIESGREGVFSIHSMLDTTELDTVCTQRILKHDFGTNVYLALLLVLGYLQVQVPPHHPSCQGSRQLHPIHFHHLVQEVRPLQHVHWVRGVLFLHRHLSVL